MLRIVFIATVGSSLLLVPASMGPVHAQPAQPSPLIAAVDRASVHSLVQDWPETPKKAADAMLSKYGPPQEATASRLIWFNNGPWKRTIVYREPVQHNFPMPHQDVLEQVIAYEVPVEKFDDLAQFDGSVIADRTKGELAARCDREEANFLAINLAHGIVRGERTVAAARDAYADTMKALMAGNPSDMTRKFTFQVETAAKGDPDRAVMR